MRVIPRARAVRDLEEAVDHYLQEAEPDVALRFIDAVEAAYDHLGRNPSSGSLRYAHEIDIPGLRCWRVQRFPYLVFYVERADHVDVWRVLHAKRDIPSWMGD